MSYKIDFEPLLCCTKMHEYHVGFYDVEGGYHMTVDEADLSNMMEINYCPFCGKEVPGKK